MNMNKTNVQNERTILAHKSCTHIVRHIVTRIVTRIVTQEKKKLYRRGIEELVKKDYGYRVQKVQLCKNK